MKHLLSFIFSIFLTCTLASTLTAQTQPQENRGLYFDGVDDVASMPSTITINGDFTIMFWLKTKQTGQGSVGPNWFNGFGLVDADNSGAVNDFGVSLANGKIRFGTGITGTDYTAETTTTVNDGAWHNIAVIRTLATGTVQIYIDGILASITGNATQSTLNLSSNLPIDIGKIQSGGNYFNGQIDEVRMFTAVRTQSLIMSDMNNVGNSGGQILYRFEEFTNTQTLSNSGTLSSSDAILGTTPTTDPSDPLRAFRVTTIGTTLGGGNILVTLPQAIFEANLYPDRNYIDFSITGTPPFAIMPTDVTKMAADIAFNITNPVIIDGYSQFGASPNTLPVGNNANILIELDGINLAASAATNINGIQISANDCIIRGLAINRFPSADFENFALVKVQTGLKNNIQGNFLGFGTDGTTIKTRAGFTSLGVAINGSATSATNANIIGGLNPQDRNVIGGFIRGVYLFNGPFTKVYNNYIGTEKTGTLARPCLRAGISLNDTQNAEIGSSNAALAVQARNVIAGNNTNIEFQFNTQNNSIANNYIGATAGGNTSLVGVTAIDISSSAGAIGNSIIGNVIVGHTNNNNGAIRIQPNVPAFTIKGNKIGVGADGITSLPNKVGIEISNNGNIIGGIGVGEGNIIANSLGTASSPSGIRINTGANNNTISGNSIYNNTDGSIFLATPVTIPTINPSPTTTTVSGTCVPCALFDTIEIFESTLGTPAQGQIYRGNTPVNNVGNWSLTGLTITAGSYITATARATNANTSAFSGSVFVPLASNDYYSSVLNGNWNMPASWRIGSITGPPATIAPSALDNVFIQSGHTITIIASSTQSIINITINGGTLEMMMGSSLNITGDLTNNSGNFTAGTGTTVTFSGGNAQSMSGTTNFVNLIINKTLPTGTVTLNNNIGITGKLTLTKGRLVANNNEIQLTNGTFAAQLSGGSIDSYVVLGATSPTSFSKLSRNNAITSAPAVFPIGATVGTATDPDYTPLTITNNGNYGSVAVRLRDVASGVTTPPLPPAPQVNRIWNLATTSSGVGVDIKINWNASNESASPLPTTTKLQTSDVATPNWATPMPNTFNGTTTLREATGTITPSMFGINNDFAIFDTPPPPVLTYFSSGLGTGDWLDPASWYTSLSPITPAITFPPSNADVTIRPTHTIKVNANEDVSFGTTIDIQSGGILSFETPLTTTATGIDNLIGVAGAKIISKAAGLPLIGINNSFATTAGTIIEFAGVNLDVIPVGFVDNPMLPSYFPYQNLIISGSGTKTLSGNTTINGNLTIENNATLDVGNITVSFDIDIKGDFTNNGGSFVARDGIVTFSASNPLIPQIISGTSAANNITINNPAGVSIINNAVISGTLTLTSGKLIANNASITLTNTNPTVLQIAGTNFPNSYVVTQGTGKLIRNGLTASNTHLFPIGTTSVYVPVSITTPALGAGGNFGASVNPAASTDLADATNFIPFIWSVETTGTANATLLFDWTALTLAPVLESATKIQRFENSTNTWTPQLQPTNTITSTSATINNIEIRNGDRQFAVFTTPATLFTPSTDIKYVQVSDDFVEFSWKTVAGATSYEVQTGTVNGVSAINWVSIPTTTTFITIGNDVTYQNKNFEYDVTTYYRVRAKGTTNSAYSSAVNIFVSSFNNPTTALNAGINKQIIISPNPTKDSFTIDSVNTIFTDNNLTFILSDMTGKVILTETTTQGLPYKMSLKNVAKGLYFVKISPLTPKGGIIQNIIKKIIKE